MFLRFFFQWTDSAVQVPTGPGLEYTLAENRLHYTIETNRMDYEMPENRLHYTMPKES